MTKPTLDPTTDYLALFDAAQLRGDGPNPQTAFVAIGADAGAFEAHVPIEFGVLRADLIPMLRSALANVVAMHAAVRAANPPDDETLAFVTVREFFVELRYWSMTHNGERNEYFTHSDGSWRRRGRAMPWMVEWPSRAPGQIMALDAAYAETHAIAAGVYFANWEADAPAGEVSHRIDAASSAYAPGEFYKRELPALMALLDQSPIPVSTLIIDGYVWLSGDGKPGLGARLYEALGHDVRVIGVAKTQFQGDDWSRPVLRGQSAAPLYVTSIGMELSAAADAIARMHGPHRTPVMLRRADQLARGV